jgi:GH25 family lysozyme M1 (1,4-beta-N-acetylmuramidase)
VTPGSPLLVDISPWSPLKPACWQTLASTGAPWSGVILKAGEGVNHCGRWFRDHAAAVRETPLDLGLYWYLRLDTSPTVQADRFADVIAETRPTLRAIVDVEEGSGNDDEVSARGAGIVAPATRAFAKRIEERTGLAPILYAGGWLRSLLPRDRMGCHALWLAAYTATLPAVEWCAQLGFRADELWAWQYAGDAGSHVESRLVGYPRTTPIGPADISAVTMPDGLARMRWLERPQ